MDKDQVFIFSTLNQQLNHDIQRLDTFIKKATLTPLEAEWVREISDSLQNVHDDIQSILEEEENE